MASKNGTKIVGFTSVVGDLLHAGHVEMLNQCKIHCDILLCGIIADPTVDRPTKNKPVQSLFERYVQLEAHKAVDKVIPLSGEDDLVLALSMLPIDIRFVGADYKGKDHTGIDICNKRGIPIVYLDRWHSLSSTELRERIAEAENGKV